MIRHHPVASTEAQNELMGDEYDAPILKLLNFPRFPGHPMEPADTTSSQGSDEASGGHYSAPIHGIPNLLPIRATKPDAVDMAIHQDEGALPPTSLGQDTRAPSNGSASHHRTEENAAPLLPSPHHMPMPPNSQPVTMDQVKEMIRDSVREAMTSLVHLRGPTSLWEMSFGSAPLPLFHPERSKSAPNRPLPKDEDDVASHLEEQLIMVFEKLMAEKGVPNTASHGDLGGKGASNGESERNQVEPASKFECKRVDEESRRDSRLISVCDRTKIEMGSMTRT
ncbi:hypothetical protein B0T17DRAFT_148634 [Bombardia bombarda]|uniref:Uncharacterized protein n=1 Tax=Bombardia bombarda TaxID=252184 RepID=A0AA39X6M8_9PEZI|nr:hypothetical protein B0T17DRAFT_148634 [Bombardia bombarda]